VKVVKARAKPLDLSNSILLKGEFREQFLAQPEASDPIVAVSGCALFDKDERLLPLVSDYLCGNFRKTKLADASVFSFAYRISYLLDDLKAKSEYESTDRDEALLSVSLGQLEAYLGGLAEAGLAAKTIVGRDAAYQHFFNTYLCKRLDESPALREDNPYETGLIRGGTAHPRGIIQPCSMQEIEQLMMHTPCERERCLLQAMYDAGIRISELPRLTLQDIRNALEIQNIHYTSSPKDRPLKSDYCPLVIMGGKGRKNKYKPRSTLVSRATLERIEDYHRTPMYRRCSRRYPTAKETPAFFNAQGGAYTTKSVEKLLYRVSKRAVKSNQIRRNISGHKFRHGSAYLFLNSEDLGADYADRLVICSRSLGHNHLNTTEIYSLIPQDIYRKLCLPGSIGKTKAAEMQGLKERTFKPISSGDKK